MRSRNISNVIAVCVLTMFLAVFSFSLPAHPSTIPGVDDIAEGELIAKHVASIGTMKALKAARSITVAGTAKAVFRGRGAGESSGIVIIASQGTSNLIGMKFDNPDYPFEKMGYDGNEFTVGFIKPGVHTVLGEFLRINKKTFEIGIMGGVLSTSWELLKYDTRTGTLKCSGTKKIEGVAAFKCRYTPGNRSDLKIDLYFDSKTFRHVRTEYRRKVMVGGVGDRYKMVENFADFKLENGLMLPHKYVLYFEIVGGGSAKKWEMDLSRFDFNNEIDPKEFKVDSY